MHHLQLDTEIRLPRKLDDEIGPTSAKLLDIVPTRRQAITSAPAVEQASSSTKVEGKGSAS